MVGAEEDTGIIGVDNTKSSLSEPIIGKLAKVDCPFDGRTGEQLNQIIFNYSIFNNFVFLNAVCEKSKNHIIYYMKRI